MFVPLFVVPNGVVTLMGPVKTSEGTTAPIVVLLVIVKPTAGVPLKETAVAPRKLTPVIRTVVKAAPCRKQRGR